jgi:hypothetical protein
MPVGTYGVMAESSQATEASLRLCEHFRLKRLDRNIDTEVRPALVCVIRSVERRRTRLSRTEARVLMERDCIIIGRQGQWHSASDKEDHE